MPDSLELTLAGENQAQCTQPLPNGRQCHRVEHTDGPHVGVYGDLVIIEHELSSVETWR